MHEQTDLVELCTIYYDILYLYNTIRIFSSLIRNRFDLLVFFIYLATFGRLIRIGVDSAITIFSQKR